MTVRQLDETGDRGRLMRVGPKGTCGGVAAATAAGVVCGVVEALEGSVCVRDVYGVRR